MRKLLIGGAALAASAIPFNAMADYLPAPQNVQVIKYKDGIPYVSTKDHLGLQIIVRDKKPSTYIVDYVGAENGDPKKAPSITVYTGNIKPDVCPAMLGIAFNYAKSGTYQATINLSEWSFVPRLIEREKCLVISNQELLRAGQIPTIKLLPGSPPQP